MATNTSDMDKTVEIRSPYRPLTRAARRALQDAVDVIEEIESDNSGRNAGVIVDERPPEELLNQHELEVVRDPVVEYETDSGEHVEVYTDPDAVKVDGLKGSDGTAEEAVEKAEESDRFTRVAGDPDEIRD